ncbi:hypothetical protein K470DRAFT_299185 [Piedraia hortae CBS 480.64]|uniref:Ribosomal RNA-processing protein 40 n=1 Tax=Piedraia hortae CBS 480.64 TaxID=1314780 RepID=A0A6A7C3E2_9PEZI|nr:hypothetical protein K470DRAFT_299185 [Piedraia hortae CBS 480.64]
MAADTADTVLLPGEQVPGNELPRSKKGTVAIGPGLYNIPPTTVCATTSGVLQTDKRRGGLWLEPSRGRYQPAVGDRVIAQVQRSGGEQYSCSLTPHTPYALLDNLAFEGASKKTRPKLEVGDVVYARVSKASRYEDTEIECVQPSSGKAEGLGPLRDGMVFSISPGFARRLMMGMNEKTKGGLVVLEEVGEKMRFEVAIGRNGKVWIDGDSTKAIIAIGRLLRKCDEEGWDVETQRQMAKRELKGLVN